MSDEKQQQVNTVVEFIKAWGHPTRNEIYGPPQRALCSRRVAARLVNSGYAKYVEGRLSSLTSNLPEEKK